MKFHLLRVARSKLKELRDPSSITYAETSIPTSGFAPDKEAVNIASFQTPARNSSIPDWTYRSNREGSAVDFLDNGFFSSQSSGNELGTVRDGSGLENAWWLNPAMYFSEDHF